MNTNDEKNIDYIIDEQGRVVFTREYHVRRGFCCGNGCMHCPYGRKKGSRKILATQKRS